MDISQKEVLTDALFQVCDRIHKMPGGVHVSLFDNLSLLAEVERMAICAAVTGANAGGHAIVGSLYRNGVACSPSGLAMQNGQYGLNGDQLQRGCGLVVASLFQRQTAHARFNLYNQMISLQIGIKNCRVVVIFIEHHLPHLVVGTGAIGLLHRDLVGIIDEVKTKLNIK